MINREPPEPSANQSSVNNQANQTTSSKSKFFSLRNKATLLAIAIGVIPVATVGLFAYEILNRSLTEQNAEEIMFSGDRV